MNICNSLFSPMGCRCSISRNTEIRYYGVLRILLRSAILNTSGSADNTSRIFKSKCGAAELRIIFLKYVMEKYVMER